MWFRNRADAGRRLAGALSSLAEDDVVVLGLPRGGVPVAAEIAAALDAPLDVIVVRKLGVPFQPELAMGAIGEEGVRFINDRTLRLAGVSAEELVDVERRERAELQRRVDGLRGGRPRIPIAGRTAVIVDDGIATGSTARTACRVARLGGADRVVLAVPVAPAQAVNELASEADEIVCLTQPDAFSAVGQFYGDFSQISEDDVRAALERADRRAGGSDVSADQGDGGSLRRDEEVEVRAGAVIVAGHLTMPEGASGIVVFAHGSGSGRHSPRNRFVASMLHRAGLGTLLFDLLSPDEELSRDNVFDIALLAGRLQAATAWVRGEREGESARIGYFGASTGAAAALWAAAEPDADVAAVVSRGGRPDLAAGRLAAVRAPTLLIVGGYDQLVLQLNRHAQTSLRCENKLAIVPGASHLFEEPGTLRTTACLARDWFVSHCAAHPVPVRP